MRRLALLFAACAALLAQGSADWHRPFPAFRIAGDLYYAGTADLAVYLIHTPQGNILINTDFKRDLPLVKKSIAQLGFAYRETKILLISHAHSDHDEATGVVERETGAKLMVMDADVRSEQSAAPGRPAARVDRVLHDGDAVELGGAKLIARLTPGHTPGCTTWTMQVSGGGRTLNVVIVGSPNVNAGTKLVGNRAYPRIADDYVKTFAILKSLPCDLFLGAHGGYFGLKAKYARMKAGDANAFVDPAGYRSYVAQRESAFRRELQRQK